MTVFYSFYSLKDDFGIEVSFNCLLTHNYEPQKSKDILLNSKLKTNDGNNVFLWLLRRVKDASGSFMEYTYSIDNTNRGRSAIGFRSIRK